MHDLETPLTTTAASPAGPKPVLEALSVRRRYGDRFVLDGVDLRLSPGSVLGLLGRNGAGKSTLLRCLLGLAPVDGGSVRVFGMPAMHLGAVEKNRIGYVAQQAAFQPWMNASQLVAYVSAFYDRWDSTLVERLLKEWDIPSSQRLSTLSAGESQRLAIILALGHHPTVLIMDEPAASLDPGGRRSVIAAVLEAVASEGTAVILSSHLTSDLERVADRVAFLAAGRISIDSDLGTLKDSIKRLRIEASTLPADFSIPGQLACEQRMGGAIATVRLGSGGSWDGLIAELATRHQASFLIEDLSLEEIFLAVTP